MGARGPKSLPDNVHKLNGNPSKKNFANHTGSDVPVEIPEPPEHLDDGALTEWGRISHELFRLGLIAKVDRAALGVYCQAYSRWAHAEGKIKEKGDDALIQSTGNGYQQIGVWLQISNRAVEQMKSFLAEFGMSPSARVKVNPSPQMGLFGDGDNGDEKGKAGKQGGAKKDAGPAGYFTQ